MRSTPFVYLVTAQSHESAARGDRRVSAKPRARTSRRVLPGLRRG
jgi:hypothetical protein